MSIIKQPNMFLRGAFITFFICIQSLTVMSSSSSKDLKMQDWQDLIKSDKSAAHTWDFEFDDKQVLEDDSKSQTSFSKATEIISENELCENLQCKPHQACVVEDDDVAVCISKRKLNAKENALKFSAAKEAIAKEQNHNEAFWKKSEDRDSESGLRSQNPCIPCPILKPDFICGTDNHTYSSVCRLEFRNCMHKAAVQINCKGFCPCKGNRSNDDKTKEWQMKDRWNRYMNKYQNTIQIPSSTSKTSKQSHSSSKIIKDSNFTTKKELTSTTDTMQKPSKSSKVATPFAEKSCNENELKAMGDRLLDWFSVVMADHQRGQSRRRSFRLSHTQLPDCKVEVGWMFQHLDTDGDMKLSIQELYDLENDDQEHCLRPYLLDCDLEQDLVLSPQEWCSCFDKSQRPCVAALRRVPQGLIGGYTPVCSKDGYYASTQCHTGSGMCWCVDRHGVEFTNTRRKERPDCEGLLKKSKYQLEHTQDNDQEDDSSEEGSADHPLDF